MATIKVKPWGKGQGDFVWIEEENFDKDFHVKLEDKEPGKQPKQRGRKRTLTNGKE